MSLWHQVCPVLCIVYCVPGIRSVVYWVLGHWVLGPYALHATSMARATALFTKLEDAADDACVETEILTLATTFMQLILR